MKLKYIVLLIILGAAGYFGYQQLMGEKPAQDVEVKEKK